MFSNSGVIKWNHGATHYSTYSSTTSLVQLAYNAEMSEQVTDVVMSASFGSLCSESSP